MKLTLELNEAQQRRLAEIAQRLGVSPTELAQAAVRELLAEPDGRFELAADIVLRKNQELYRRLS